MPFSLLAETEVKSLTELTPDWCREKGIRLILLDFDNTVVPYTVIEPTEKMAAWLRDMPAAGIHLAVVSNTKKDRVVRFCEEWNIPVVIRAHKPRPDALLAMMRQLGFRPEETAMAGDQTYTDMIAGNLAGVHTVLCYPILFSNPLYRVRYWAEMPFILAGRIRRSCTKDRGNT